MLIFEEALALTISKSRTHGVELVALDQALNRVLAQDLFADVNMPPFDKSAMDGFACKKSDLGQDLEIVEVIQAGQIPEKEIHAGQCAQIMTGAVVPPGADVVIMVEETEAVDSKHIRFTANFRRSNICYLGEDLKTGDLVMKKGTLISPQHIPSIASVGGDPLMVYRQPRIGILATGTELVEPKEIPDVSQIRNSNAAQMLAQLKQIGFHPQYFGIATDDQEETYRKIQDALEQSDVLLLSGGVSMGEFDFVPAVLQSLGLEILYQKLAVQPGKPTTFAIKEGKTVFALPGNPVSSFIQLELLVKPYLYRCMACDWSPKEFQLRTGARFERKKTDRKSWIPIKFNASGQVVSLEYHGSAHIFSLSQAKGFICHEIGQAVIEEGEMVYVRSI